MNMEKQKQFMLLMLIAILSATLLLGTGCGQGKSCELPKASCESEDNMTGMGVSIPGCGGCLSSGSGWGCDTCGLWSQSVKIVAVSANREYIVVDDKKDKKDNNDKESKEENTRKETDSAFVIGLDDQYYVNEGCGGCQNNKIRAIYGVAACDSPATWLISVGHYPKGELFIGCGSGCGSIGACGKNKPGRELLNILEDGLDVR